MQNPNDIISDQNRQHQQLTSNMAQSAPQSENPTPVAAYANNIGAVEYNQGPTAVQHVQEEVPVDEVVEYQHSTTLSGSVFQPTVESVLVENTTSVRVVPRVVLTLRVAEHNELPDTVQMRRTTYSLASPLRKGKGTSDDPAGILRSSLSSLFTALAEFNNAPTVIGGDSDYLDAVAAHVEYIVTNTLLEPNGGEQHFCVPVMSLRGAEPATGTASMEDMSRLVTFDFDDFVTHSIIASASTTEPNTVLLNVNITVVLPMLASDPSRMFLSTSRMLRSFKNYAASTIGIENAIFALALDADSVLNPDYVEFFSDLRQEDVDATIVGRSGIAEGLGLFGPHLSGFFEMIDQVFAYGGDLLAVVSDIPNREPVKVVKKKKKVR